MNFSLDWFLSIPGLLITGGVLLLLIALIILIVTGRKKKDKTDSNESTTTATETSTVPEQTAAPTAPTGAVPEMNSPALATGNIMDIPAPIEQVPVAQANMNTMGMTNTMPQPGPMATTPTMEMPAAPVVEQAPTVEQLTPVTPVMDTSVPATPEPVVQQPTPVIYGGASPIVPEMTIPQEQHQIYGGANPLENTQSIPISNLVGQPVQPAVQQPAPEPTLVVEQQQAPVQPTNIGQ